MTSIHTLRQVSAAAEARVTYLSKIKEGVMNAMMAAHDAVVAAMSEEDRKLLDRDDLIAGLTRALGHEFEQLQDDADEVAHKARHAVLDYEIEQTDRAYSERCDELAARLQLEAAE